MINYFLPEELRAGNSPLSSKTTECPSRPAGMVFVVSASSPATNILTHGSPPDCPLPTPTMPGIAVSVLGRFLRASATVVFGMAVPNEDREDA
jgi:hypothetical protein